MPSEFASSVPYILLAAVASNMIPEVERMGTLPGSVSGFLALLVLKLVEPD